MAKSIAELLKSLSAGAGKDTLKSLQAVNVPPDVKLKIAANPPDHVLTLVLGTALLWEWIKKLRERPPAGSAGR